MCGLGASGVVTAYLVAAFFFPFLRLGSMHGTVETIGMGVAGLGCAVTIVGFVLHARAREHAVRTLIANDFRFCPCCAYDLREVEVLPCACPECGLQIESCELVKAHWGRQYGGLVSRRRDRMRFLTRKEQLLLLVWHGHWAGLFVVFAGTILAVATLRASVGMPALGAAVLLWIVMFIGCGIAGALYRRARRRAVAELAQRDFLLCTCCAYDLGSTPMPGQCPECGGELESPEVVRRYWTAIYRADGGSGPRV